MYAIKKIDGLYRVITVSNQRVVFSSACRLNCRDFLAENGPKPEIFRIDGDGDGPAYEARIAGMVFYGSSEKSVRQQALEAIR